MRWVSRFVVQLRDRYGLGAGEEHGATAALRTEGTDFDDSTTVFVGPLHKNPSASERHENTEPASSKVGPVWPARDRQKSYTMPVQPENVRKPISRSLLPDDCSARATDDVHLELKHFDIGDDAPTKLVSAFSGSTPTSLSHGDGPKPLVPKVVPAATLNEPSEKTVLVGQDALSSPDPVTGWLVVIDGPGKGRSVEIGMGNNSIGRAPDQKVCLDFGDTHISRERHAVLVYDPRSKCFFLQHGDNRSLTYVGKKTVLTRVKLKGGEIITVGNTQLRFVTFCGPKFSWS